MGHANHDARTCLLLAAHPDDETIGAGIWMTRFSGSVAIAHVTDGSPMDLKDARLAGFETREEYANARRREFRRALEVAGLSDTACFEFGFTDQTVHLHIGEFVEKFRDLLEQLRPEVVIAPPYEGGHPDHDSIAYAVAAVRAEFGFRHREHRLYHANADGSLNVEDFLWSAGRPAEVVALGVRERELKRRTLASFETQKKVLEQFPVQDERFRDAPTYDFSCPPHGGMLMYEQWGLGVGEEWRDCICRAVAR